MPIVIYFNNLNGVPRSLYRFFVGGYTLGGPVYIPKVWNVARNKLFFFVSNEWTLEKPATQITYAQMPTAAERAGGLRGQQRKRLIHAGFHSHVQLAGLLRQHPRIRTCAAAVATRLRPLRL
jgi:hypothetical protein